ncbi:MAG TPA: lysylphosphatidylglycerol synthase transmembrane domain-containing protein [Kofleriaceae bacterium]|nr:lysylphosphatidylglycerol synthase transmembrane domain-containing protein [Kofleriaceae bacterium]
MARIKQHLLGIAKMIVAGLLIWWLVESGTLDLSALGVFWERPILLVANFAFFAFSNVIVALRWRLLLGLAGVELSLRRAMALQLVGAFFNVAMPGNIGGDVLKTIYVARDVDTEQRATVFAITLLDRVVALAGLVATAAILTFEPHGAVWGDARFHQVATAIAVLAVVTLLGPLSVLLIIRRYGSRMDRWASGKTWIGRIISQLVLCARLVSARLGALLASLGLAMAIHVIGIMWFTALATEITAQDVSLSSMASVYPLGMLSTLLPISYAGFGVGHIAFEQLFAMVGLHGGATVLNVYLVGLTIPCVVGVIPYFTLRREVQISPEST